MDLIPRQLESKLRELSTKYPFVTLTGPRQSGKSTLARMAFPDYRVVSLEDLDMRIFAESDPRGFISTYSERVIIDEVQRVPTLLSYLQTFTDQHPLDGRYILTGSQNESLIKAVDQSLAGRTALLYLLPFSEKELFSAHLNSQTVDQQIFEGGYPRLFAKGISPGDFYPSYISTYLERDVRQMSGVGDLDKFSRFVKLCAGRLGCVLNKSSLAIEAGVSVPTADRWLSVLQSSYIIYLLPPYHNSFNKRLIKSPVLYFYDTGLACSLLDILSSQQVENHYLRGHLFENLVINEIYKGYFNKGIKPSLAFWRDSAGQEVDLVDYTGGTLRPYEIKSGATFNPSFFKNLTKWGEMASVDTSERTVVYTGEQSLQTSHGQLLAWRELYH
ncbi:MAG: ATP-binding protein [Bacteroidales bacterium]|nr:ATP-binding protein [Bacteroidales bacterium]